MKETAKEAFERCLQNVSLEEKPDAEWVAQQYAVERAGALAIKEAAPFSEERGQITRQCYEMVDRLIQARSRQKGQSVAAYGAGESFVDLLDQLIRYLHTKKPEINFFEAGVGTGYILRAVHQFGGVHVSGCDVCLDRQLLGELSSCCIEKTLYAALGELKDGSVDLFYWNDVMEHLPEDEMEETLTGGAFGDRDSQQRNGTPRHHQAGSAKGTGSQGTAPAGILLLRSGGAKPAGRAAAPNLCGAERRYMLSGF